MNVMRGNNKNMAITTYQQDALTFYDFIRFQFVIQQSFFLSFEVDRRKKKKRSKCTSALQYMKCMIYGRITIDFGFGTDPYIQLRYYVVCLTLILFIYHLKNKLDSSILTIYCTLICIEMIIQS